MPRQKTFTFRVDIDERMQIAELASSLQRTQSDALRLIIRQRLQNLDLQVKQLPIEQLNSKVKKEEKQEDES